MIKKLKLGLLIAVLSLSVSVGVGSAQAAAGDISFGAAHIIDLSIPDVDDMTIASGSTASAFSVGTGSIAVTAADTDTFTVSSASRGLYITSNTGVAQTCTSGTAQIVITGSGAGVAYTISPTASQCGGTGSSGGGGGGSTATDTTAPTATSISINAGATTASSLSSTLTLAATGATQMMISNDAGFAGASWENFSSTSKAWTLASGDGVKTVYAKFKDAAGNTSTAVSDTITLSGSGTVALPPVPLTEGCSAGNLYNPVTGALCVNNAGAEIPGCGNRTTGFSSATGVSCVENRVTAGTPNAPGASGYNFGATTLKNGSKGEAVKELQRFLNVKLNLGLVVDGKLGPKTIAVIKKWQKDNGLVADGLIGAKTKAKMNASVQ